MRSAFRRDGGRASAASVAAHRHLGELVVRRAEDAKREVHPPSSARSPLPSRASSRSTGARRTAMLFARQRAAAKRGALLRSRCIGYAARSSGSVDSSSVVRLLDDRRVVASGNSASSSSPSPSASPLPPSTGRYADVAQPFFLALAQLAVAVGMLAPVVAPNRRGARSRRPPPPPPTPTAWFGGTTARRARRRRAWAAADGWLLSPMIGSATRSASWHRGSRTPRQHERRVVVERASPPPPAADGPGRRRRGRRRARGSALTSRMEQFGTMRPAAGVRW